MGLYIIIFWMIYTLNAPAWCYVMFGITSFAQILRWCDKQKLKSQVEEIMEDIYIDE